jgi:hypothetical protein
MDELVTALASSWDAIRARHEEVPPVILAVGSHPRKAKLPCMGGFVTARWSPGHAGEPPALQALREQFDDAIARGDLVRALGASSEVLLIRAMLTLRRRDAVPGRGVHHRPWPVRSSADVLGILLPEAAHAIADRRGIKDTSRQGRYHNARFRTLADEVGLEVRGHH